MLQDTFPQNRGDNKTRKWVAVKWVKTLRGLYSVPFFQHTPVAASQNSIPLLIQNRWAGHTWNAAVFLSSVAKSRTLTSVLVKTSWLGHTFSSHWLKKLTVMMYHCDVWAGTTWQRRRESIILCLTALTLPKDHGQQQTFLNYNDAAQLERIKQQK